MTLQERIEGVYEAVTEYDCTSYDDIGVLSAMSPAMVAITLWEIRKPEMAQHLGWTIPHVKRGRGHKIFRVVVNGDGEDLSPFVEDEFIPGTVSSLRAMATMGEGQGHALRETALHGTPTQARMLRRVATAIEGAAAMARDMAETLS